MNGCCIGNYDFCIDQNATLTKVFTWLTNPCCGAVGSAPAPVDLTGYSAGMQIRPFVLSTTLLFDATPYITLGGPAGTITLSIPGGITAALTWFSGVYDLLLLDQNGISTRLLSGQVTVCPGITAPLLGPQFVLLPGGQAALVPGGQGVVTP
jgi:hypothetical protein